MSKLSVILIVLLVASQTTGCAYIPKRTAIQTCIELAGEVITAYCLKPKGNQIEKAKTKDEISEEITRQYAQKWAEKNDKKGELIARY